MQRKLLSLSQNRGWRLFIKNTSLCLLVRGCIGIDTCPLPPPRTTPHVSDRSHLHVMIYIFWGRSSRIVPSAPSRSNLSDRICMTQLLAKTCVPCGICTIQLLQNISHNSEFSFYEQIIQMIYIEACPTLCNTSSRATPLSKRFRTSLLILCRGLESNI